MASASNKKRKIAASDQSSPTCGTIVISDLNDDCLREICEHLDLSALCVFADVCSRFKRNAEASFASLKLKAISKIMWENLPARNQYRLVRNFGASITSLAAVKKYDTNEDAIIDLILHYCVESLNALTLHYFGLNDEIGRKLRPLLLRLQKFGIIDCKCTDSFIDMLPSCLSNLRDLELKSEIPKIGSFIRSYPELEAFSTGYLKKWEFRKFLIKNQQLKSIELDYRLRSTCDYFNIIIKHLPRIESLNIFVRSRFSSNGVNKGCLHRMTALKKLVIRGASDLFSSTLRDIAAANIPIESFALYSNRYRQNIMNVIPQFKKLKSLQLVEMQSMDYQHLIRTSKSFGGVTEFYWQSVSVGCCWWRKIDLLEFIEAAEKLQKLYYVDTGGDIDVDTYMKIVNIVKNRSGHNHLEIISTIDSPWNNVPEKIKNEKKHLVGFEMIKSGQIIDFGVQVTDEEASETDSDTNDSSDFYDYNSDF